MIKTVKRFIPKCIKESIREFLNKIYYKNMLKDLANYNGKKRIILIGTPEHGNLGDQAITEAELKFIKENLNQYELAEISGDFYRNQNYKIKNHIKESDIIIVHGGGFIGTLWPLEQEMILDILNNYKNNKLIVFPQTVFFEESFEGNKEKKKFKLAIENCSNLKIFLRDAKSYEIMLNQFGMLESKCFLVPDIVTYLEPQINISRQNKVLFCLRGDKEKTLDDNILLPVKNVLNSQGIEVEYIDTVINRKINKEERTKLVWNKLEEISSSRLVITDRLHGMIFATITGTPCIALDNISKKVSGTFEWIKYLDYIKFINKCELNDELIQSMLKKENCKYSNKELKDYYEIIEKEILE